MEMAFKSRNFYQAMPWQFTFYAARVPVSQSYMGNQESSGVQGLRISLLDLLQGSLNNGLSYP